MGVEEGSSLIQRLNFVQNLVSDFIIFHDYQRNMSSLLIQYSTLRRKIEDKMKFKPLIKFMDQISLNIRC